MNVEWPSPEKTRDCLNTVLILTGLVALIFCSVAVVAYFKGWIC